MLGVSVLALQWSNIGNGPSHKCIQSYEWIIIMNIFLIMLISSICMTVVWMHVLYMYNAHVNVECRHHIHVC